MKIVILRNNLKNALDAVSHALGDSSGLPILKNVLIRAESGRILLCSTNLEMAVVRTVAGKLIDEGSITIPFALFNNIVGNIQSERMEISSKGKGIIIKTDNYEAVIQGLSADEYPIIPKIENKDEYLSMTGESFKNSLEQVVSAAQISELRPEISGILFDIEPASLKLVATDTFRLAEKTVPFGEFENRFSKGNRFIIPLKPIQELLRIIDSKGEVKIYISTGQVMVESEGVEVISRLIEGEFPNYSPIIPKELTTEIVVDKIELNNSLKLASAFTSRGNEVRLKVLEGEGIEVYSADSLLGENRYSIPAKVSGERIEVCFNWRYMMDGLKSIEGESVIIGLQGNIRPSLLKSSIDKTFFYVLMPMKSS